MPINPNYKKPKIVAGELKIPVAFFEYRPSDGLEPTEEKKQELYFCTALAYNPSMKDRDILGTKEGLTIKIRDPHESYIPTNKHKVEIRDYRYQKKDKSYKVWEVVDVALDFEDNRFIKIVLGATS